MRIKQLFKQVIATACAVSMVLVGMPDIGAAKVQAASGTGPIDVWDFGCVQETNTTLYKNNIDAADWNALPATALKGGKFVTADTKVAETVAFGDLTLAYLNNDRLYCEGSSAPSQSMTGAPKGLTTAFDDGYTPQGGYYCNGTGGETRRYMDIANVHAGDVFYVYMVAHNSSDQDNLVFAYRGEDHTQKDEENFSGTAAKYVFTAKYSGTYRIYTTANAAKPGYSRIVRIPAATVSGKISAGTIDGMDAAKVKFVNASTKEEYDATRDGADYSANLPAGYDYNAVLVGLSGYGFTNASKRVSVALTDAGKALTGKDLVVEEKHNYTYSGKITGLAEGYDTSRLKVILKAAAESMAEDVELTLTGLDFTASLEPDVAYTIEVQGANDYSLKSAAAINSTEDVTSDIELEAKALYTASGSFVGLGDAQVTALTFTNVDDEYSYTATVTDNTYTVSLRDGAYLATATADGYATKTHVVVAGKDVTKDLLFVSTAAAGALTRVADLYVGYAGKDNNYATVKEAVKAASLMNPTKEEERITIHIAPGTYREQLMIETPYLSFVNDEPEKGEVLITWYYGIGYKYYSSNGGYYDPEYAFDQYAKAKAEKWGVAVYIKKAATAFRAKNIIFENSFNRYVTEEEIEDGVELLQGDEKGDSKITVERNFTLDVKAKVATERASALVIDADKAEFQNCQFLSSQDTLYAGNDAAYTAYFKNCVIEGQTDYIFGRGKVVFDACELRWAGYTTDTEVAGHVTALKAGDSNKLGYLFRNCVVTAASGRNISVAAGDFGRPWEQAAAVTLLNTKLAGTGLISDEGWSDWNATQTASNADYYEYNTTYLDGTAVDVSKRTGHTLSAEAAAAVKPETYFGEWTPAFYTAEAATLAFKTAPYLVDNGDINAPYPGHTFTAAYSLGDNDANDASVISWYSVKDGVETLVKTGSAVSDRTYKVQTSDIGAKIKVTVAPQTIGGKTAEAASYTVPAKILDGYDDPSKPAGDLDFGDGLTIFLAGDSTVKDYSATGMYMSGVANDLGAWGEYFQSFFDRDKVTIANYANGGRSTRNYINEGTLEKIGKKLKAGDYLFIQFGHNDCSNGSGYTEDRYVPLGEPDANGIYPVTAGTKVSTPSTLVSKYGETFYSYDCGGTYKWYLKQYIDTAKSAGAIPVLVTPVARMYYNADGTIKDCHDSTDTTTGTQVTSGNAYVTAMKQLAEEEKVACIDGFELTKIMFEDAYKAAGNDTYGQQVMGDGDKTHNNKLGGFIEAALMAQAVQNLNINISRAVVQPSNVNGQTTKNQTVFKVTRDGKITAYDILKSYAEEASYWTTTGQKMIDDIAAKAEELQKSSGGKTPAGTGDGEEDGNLVATFSEDSDLDIVYYNGTTRRFEYVYTGDKATPAIVVTNGSKVMTEGVDYTVKYSNNQKVDKNSKPAVITITGKGNYSGKQTLEFYIVPKDLSESDVVVGNTTIATGSKANPVVLYKGVKLTGKDYTVSKTDKLSADTTVDIIAKEGGNYTGKIEGVEIKVVDKSALQKVKADLAKGLTRTYNGEEQTLEIGKELIISDAKAKTPLEEGKYAVSYSNNKNAGTVKVTIVGLDEYTGSVTKKFKIQPNKSVKLTAEPESADGDGGYVFRKAGVTPKITVTADDSSSPLNGTVLTEGVDYKVSYGNNKKVGSANYTVTFLGNYKGNATVAKKQPFSIVAADLTDAEVYVFDMPFNVKKTKGSAYMQKPFVVVNGELLANSDYALTYSIDKKAAVSAGTEVKVTITGKNNYGQTAEAAYTVVETSATDISKAKVSVKAKNKTIGYTGTAIEFDPADADRQGELNVKLGSTLNLTSSEAVYSAFDVIYLNNVKKGKATVIIAAKDDTYAGFKAGTFSIGASNLQEKMKKQVDPDTVKELLRKLSGKG